MELSSRLIREIHGVLLGKGRGAEKQPGAFRTPQYFAYRDHMTVLKRGTEPLDH